LNLWSGVFKKLRFPIGSLAENPDSKPVQKKQKIIKKNKMPIKKDK
jgi:hypothetical protein